MKHGTSSNPCYLQNPPHHEPDAHGLSIVKLSMACSGCCALVRHGAIYPNDMGPWKTVYNRFNRWSKSGVINFIFNRLLSLPDANGFVDWSATALDGSNIRALKCAAGAQKNIPISMEIMGWVAFAVVLAPKSIWQQTQADSR